MALFKKSAAIIATGVSMISAAMASDDGANQGVDLEHMKPILEKNGYSPMSAYCAVETMEALSDNSDYKELDSLDQKYPSDLTHIRLYNKEFNKVAKFFVLRLNGGRIGLALETNSIDLGVKTGTSLVMGHDGQSALVTLRAEGVFSQKGLDLDLNIKRAFDESAADLKSQDIELSSEQLEELNRVKGLASSFFSNYLNCRNFW